MTAPLSPRRRHLRWTATTLIVALLAGAGVTWDAWRRSQPVSYRPDETSESITSALARGLPPGAPRPRWTDVTAAAGLSGFRNFAGHRTSQLPEDMGPGLAWGDFDNDGDEDLFLVSAGGALNLSTEELLPCALYENMGDGTFRRVETFPELRLRGMGAAWVDYDGDGWLDLAVSGYEELRLLRNEQGTGAFTVDARIEAPRHFWSGVSWGDFNNDRRLDLYVCAYVEYAENESDASLVSDQLGTAVPYTLNPASYPGGRNALYRQNPDGSFTDVAVELGVQNPEGRSLGALWHDFDQDGWLDLYIANDVSDNVLFHNRHGRFVEISHPAWVADYRSAMGLAVGDFDRDGDDDLFVSHWVAQENGLYENLWANLGPTHTNRLRFVDIADQKGLGQISLPRVGWGSLFADLDHDGWLDLVCVNGNTIEEAGPPPRTLKPQAPFLFWNRHGQSFHDLAPLDPVLAAPHVSRGLAAADYDNDGDLDLVIADLYEGVRLFRNERVTGNWLKLHLRSRNADGQPTGYGEGSTAVARIDGVGLRRSVTGVSYLSQESRLLHWGLGSASHVDQLEVHWHAGSSNRVQNIEANSTWIWTEGDPAPRRFHADAQFTSITPATGPAPIATAATTHRERTLQFWALHRSAMDALKREKDPVKAIPMFRQAIDLNPAHEDARYYLALCLAACDDPAGALESLSALRELNPQSHRAWQQWGIIMAQSADSDADLAAAEASLQRAHELNTAETGALLLLGEISLLRGHHANAVSRLTAVCQGNPKAAGGFFFRAYLAWKSGDTEASSDFLLRAREALGPDWQPQGATSEGDVRVKQHDDVNLLGRFWQSWAGESNPDAAFTELQLFLNRRSAVD